MSLVRNSIELQEFIENTPGVIQFQDIVGLGKGIANSPAATVEAISRIAGLNLDLSPLKLQVDPREASGALIGEGIGPGPVGVARGLGKGFKLAERAFELRIEDPAFRLGHAEVDVTRVAEQFETSFGKKPEAIFLVGSRAERALGNLAIDVSKSDIDLFIQTDITELSKFDGPGFEFFKLLNPNKIPRRIIGVGDGPRRALIGAGRGEIPKAGLIDPFFGPAGGLIPGLPAVQLF